MPSRALVLSGKSLVPSGKSLAAPKARTLDIKRAKVVELVPKGSSKSGKSGKTSVGGATASNQQSEESGSESEEKPPQKLSTLLVRGDIVASLLGGGDGAEALVRENSLFQGNSRTKVGGIANRREGGTGYGRGGGGGGGGGAKPRRAKAGATAEPAQTKRIREPLALPSPGAKPLALPSPGAKPLALPSPGAKPLALPSPDAKPLALPSPGALKIAGDSPVVKIGKAIKEKVTEKATEGVKATGEQTLPGQLAALALEDAKQTLPKVKALWKAGDYAGAVRESTKSKANPAYAAFVGTNAALDSAKWLAAQIKKL